MTIKINPFGFNQPISDYKQFIGRREELAEILKRILQGRSVSIVGMPKVGSTSLLRCLSLQDLEKEFDIELGQFVPVYISMHAHPTATTGQLFESIALSLEEKIPDTGRSFQSPETDAKHRGYRLDEHEHTLRRLRHLRTEGFKPLILIDEFDYVLVNPNIDHSILKLMLYLQESGNAKFTTSSHIAATEIEQRLTPLHDRSSKPLGGDDTYLMPFTLEETELYLRRLPSPLRSNRKLEQFIMAVSGGHPYLLRLACFHAVEQHDQRGTVDHQVLWKEFTSDAESYFDVLLETLPGDFHDTLNRIDERQLQTCFLRRQAESKTSLSIPAPRAALAILDYNAHGGGVIRPQSNGEYKVFSYAFGQYLIRRRRLRTKMAKGGRVYYWRVRRMISEHFSLEDLRTLCFDLGVDFENLGGRTKDDKVRELLLLMKNAGRTDSLIGAVKERRPGLQWPD